MTMPVCILALYVMLCAVSDHITAKQIKKQINNIKSEIAESRTREDLLLQEVKQLDYLIDILSKAVLE